MELHIHNSDNLTHPNSTQSSNWRPIFAAAAPSQLSDKTLVLLKDMPLPEEQAPQIGVREVLALPLMALIVPSPDLADLSTAGVSDFLITSVQEAPTLSQYQAIEHRPHSFRASRFATASEPLQAWHFFGSPASVASSWTLSFSFSRSFRPMEKI